MAETGPNSYLELPPDPLEVLRAWPPDRPVVMLHSGDSGQPHRRWNRWSILASPQRWVIADECDGDPLESIESALDQSRERQGACCASEHQSALPYGRGSDLPFVGGWIGFLSYDLGCAIETAARAANRPRDDRRWPLLAFAQCPDALVFDHVERRWSGAGDSDLAEVVRSRLAASHVIDEAKWRTSELRSSLTPDAYFDIVQRALDYIAAGDIFQANITQRFTASFEGSARAFAREAIARSGAPYGAYLELPGDRWIISMSPELFLEVQPLAASRGQKDYGSPATSDANARPQAAVTARPIKGTRPMACDPRELRDSVKDAAELHMIVDLMRNDLGRVCEYGSVRVAEPRSIETYPASGVHHGVAEITGTLRRDATIIDLLRATFPAGSITGAPKIRAMQIIDELEQFRGRRGPYCGAIGFISDGGLSGGGHATFNVAIRTISISNGLLDYGAGGGIVADSDPAAEYRECMDKTQVLRKALQKSESFARSGR